MSNVQGTAETVRLRVSRGGRRERRERQTTETGVRTEEATTTTDSPSLRENRLCRFFRRYPRLGRFSVVLCVLCGPFFTPEGAQTHDSLFQPKARSARGDTGGANGEGNRRGIAETGQIP